MKTINLKQKSKVKYIKDGGEQSLLIDDAKSKVRHGTKILVLTCKNEKGEIFKKEFSYSDEGITYLIQFIEDTKILTSEEMEVFHESLLLGKMFVTEFGRKKNPNFDGTSDSNEFYIYELPNKAKEYKK